MIINQYNKDIKVKPLNKNNVYVQCHHSSSMMNNSNDNANNNYTTSMNNSHENDDNNRRNSLNGNDTAQQEEDENVDALMNTIMRKLTHVHIDTTQKIHPYDYCIENTKIEQLLPYQQRGIVQALLSDVTEYQINAMVKLRKYLSLEKISNNINNVLALRMNPRFVELLRSPSPILQYETCWVFTNIAAGTTAQTRSLIDAGAVPALIELLKSENKDVRTQAAWSLGNIAGDCGEFRDVVLHEGALQPLLELWNGNESIETKNHMLQVAMWTLANLCRWHRSDWDVLAPAFPILRQSIYFEDSAILSETCWALSRIFHGSHPKVTHLLDLELCQRLVELLRNESVSVVNPVLRTLTNIAYGDDQQTQLIITAGAIPVLYELLSSSNASIRLETILVLANITAGTVEQIQSVIDAGCLKRLVEIFGNPKESFKIRKEACWAISNATDVKHPVQTRTIVKMGIIVLMLNFLTECIYDNVIQQKCLDALENILTVCDSELSKSKNTNLLATNSYSAGNWKYDPWKVSSISPHHHNNSVTSISTINASADNLLSKSLQLNSSALNHDSSSSSSATSISSSSTTSVSGGTNTTNTANTTNSTSDSYLHHTLNVDPMNSILRNNELSSATTTTTSVKERLKGRKSLGISGGGSNILSSSRRHSNSALGINKLTSPYKRPTSSTTGRLTSTQYMKWSDEMSSFNQLWKTAEILENTLNKSGYCYSQGKY